jgi:hypothetical protein
MPTPFHLESAAYETAWHAQRGSTLPWDAKQPSASVDFRVRANLGPDQRRAVRDWSRLQLLLVEDDAERIQTLVADLVDAGVDEACLFEEALRAGNEALASRFLYAPFVGQAELRSLRSETSNHPLVSLGDVVVQFGSMSFMRHVIDTGWFDPLAPIDFACFQASALSWDQNTWTPLAIACRSGNADAVEALMENPGVRQDPLSLNEALFILCQECPSEWETGAFGEEDMPLPESRMFSRTRTRKVVDTLLDLGANPEHRFPMRRLDRKNYEWKALPFSAGQAIFERAYQAGQTDALPRQDWDELLVRIESQLVPASWSWVEPLPTTTMSGWSEAPVALLNAPTPASPFLFDTALAVLDLPDPLAWVVGLSGARNDHWPLRHWVETRGCLSIEDLDRLIIGPLRDKMTVGSMPRREDYDFESGRLGWRGLSLTGLAGFLPPEDHPRWAAFVEGAVQAKADYDHDPSAQDVLGPRLGLSLIVPTGIPQPRTSLRL